MQYKIMSPSLKIMFLIFFFQIISFGWWLVLGTSADVFNHQEAIVYFLFKSYTFSYLQGLHDLLKFNLKILHICSNISNNTCTITFT